MKICLYSPYIPKHFGGGEKYLLDVARILGTKAGVVIGVSEADLTPERAATIKQSYEEFLAVPLPNVNFVSTPLGTPADFWTKLNWTRQFDVMYYLTDGSLFFSAARKNILHIQIPFTDSKRSVSDRLKLANWQIKNTNSEFTKQVIERHWHTKINLVHQPMVGTVPSLDFEHKQSVILNVGRFFRQLHSKRQDILVEMFRQLRQTDPKGTEDWQLVLIGAVEDQEYLQEVKMMAKGLPVKILNNVSRAELETWYDRASIYWHATGFGYDEQLHPERMEHFGISTVEAMARGAAPVVIGKGGQNEILGTQLHQWSWQTLDEGIAKTLELLHHPQTLHTVQKEAAKRAKVFDEATFERKLWRMIES